MIMYVDDIGVAAPMDALLNEFVADLKSKGFELTREGSFSKFLGMKFEEERCRDNYHDTKRNDKENHSGYRPGGLQPESSTSRCSCSGN